MKSRVNDKNIPVNIREESSINFNTIEENTIMHIDEYANTVLEVPEEDSVSFDLQNQVTFTSGGSSSSNYNDLTNKPQIEGVTLVGNKTFADLTLVRLSNMEIEILLN